MLRHPRDEPGGLWLTGEGSAASHQQWPLSGEAAGPWFGPAPQTGCQVRAAGSARPASTCACWQARAGNAPESPSAAGGLPRCRPWSRSPGRLHAGSATSNWQADPGAVLCYSRHGRWKGLGRPDLEEFITGYDQHPDGRQPADPACLPDRLRLEVQ